MIQEDSEKAYLQQRRLVVLGNGDADACNAGGCGEVRKYERRKTHTYEKVLDVGVTARAMGTNETKIISAVYAGKVWTDEWSLTMMQIELCNMCGRVGYDGHEKRSLVGED